MDFETKVLNMVKNETIPATGCTEPIAVAYAASVVRDYLDGSLESLNILTSKGIFKNGKSVKIPGIKVAGLDLAGVLGFVGGDSSKELLVLDEVDCDTLSLSKKILREKEIKLDFLSDCPSIYVEIEAKDNLGNSAKVILANSHNNIVHISKNGKVLMYKDINNMADENKFLLDSTFKDILNVVEGISLDKLDFIEEGLIMNLQAGEKGLEAGLGLGLGRALKGLQDKNLLGLDSPTKARILTGAAADLRMGGGICPIMTSAGSGNQGLGVIIPIAVIGMDGDIDEEKILRAIFFAHILNKYVKTYTGKLSYMCGCAIGAGVGASAAITWLLGGSLSQIHGAVNNILSNLSGMFCDGAKNSCSFKLSTSAAESIISAYLAINDIITEPDTGLVSSSGEETIKNIGHLCDVGYPEMDMALIEMMK